MFDATARSILDAGCCEVRLDVSWRSILARVAARTRSKGEPDMCGTSAGLVSVGGSGRSGDGSRDSRSEVVETRVSADGSTGLEGRLVGNRLLVGCRQTYRCGGARVLGLVPVETDRGSV